MNPTCNESTDPAVLSEHGRRCMLFVDDDRDIQSAARMLFLRRGIEVLPAHDAREALTLLAVHAVDLVLLDLNYTRGATTGTEGLALLRDMLLLRPRLPVVVVTGHSGVTIAVEAMRAGATDFVMKPWNNARLLALTEKILDRRPAAPPSGSLPILMVSSSEMARVVSEADRLAPTRAPLLVCGPTGTGKMLLAHRIHDLSHETGETHILSAQDCETLPDETGTWIIRDIEALPSPLQRALADRFDMGAPPRVIALSSLDPSMLQIKLHPRLLMHLGIVTLRLPALEDRRDDIPVLAAHFLHYFSQRHGLPEPILDGARLATLVERSWPQNVRELRSSMERTVLTGQWETEIETPSIMKNGMRTLHDTERSLIEATLRRHGFNVTRAARDLGLTRPALYRRMARYGL